MKTAACYLRVSTDDQHASNQLDDVEQLCRARGFEPVWYSETASAAAKRRPEFERMMADVKRGKHAAVVVWALDRLHRNLFAVVRDVTELDRLHVRLLSVRDTWLDVEGPQRSLLVAVLGWVAQFERERLKERTRAGLDRARREGKTLGRPRVSPVLLGVAADMHRDGSTLADAAAGAGVSESSLRRHLKRVKP